MCVGACVRVCVCVYVYWGYVRVLMQETRFRRQEGSKVENLKKRKWVKAAILRTCVLHHAMLH
jgi:hypothetical protein